jgi:tetratricopeptide (TPR) repeat protein
MLLMEMREWEKAIDAYKESLARNASTPQAYCNMGLCYTRMGKKEAAIKAFDKALAVDPDYEPAIANKMITETLTPGEKSDGSMKVVEYYKDDKQEGRSYLEE